MIFGGRQKTTGKVEARLKNTLAWIVDLGTLNVIDVKEWVMNVPKVTVVVLTYNRSNLLKICLESVLNQDYDDFRVIVSDNASTDATKSVIRSMANPKIRYVRHPYNIGQHRNWNFAIETNTSPYLCIFHDDDVMKPGFIRRLVQALDKHASAGIAVSCVNILISTGYHWSTWTILATYRRWN